MSGPAKVLIARHLLDAGARVLRERYEVVEGGLDAGAERVRELAPGARALVADPTVEVGGDLLDACGPALAIVANFAVGFDNVDLEECAARGIPVTNTPDVLTEATAELALTLALAAARRTGEAERDLRAGRWTGWDPSAYRGLELRGATVGVVGLGRIGRRFAELAIALGAGVVYSAPRAAQAAERDLGARRLELGDLCREADVVSLHARASDSTRHMIGAAELDAIGPGGVLVNTARGALVDEPELARALIAGRLGAAGLDVYENEPQVHPDLLAAPNCVLLPHIGSATVTARDAMAKLAAENVIAVLEGRPPLTPVAP